jgi:hypothetical protein
MNVLVIQFRYTMPTASLLESLPGLAPAFAAIPGCFEKTWLHDEEKKLAGGVYKFRDGAALEAYLASALWKGVESNPGFEAFDVRTFEVPEEATAITGGLPALAAAR